MASQNVVYLGFVQGEQRFKLLRECEFMVLPSHTENFGVVIGESLACEVPVITSKNTPWEILNSQDCGACVLLDDFSLFLETYLAKSSQDLKNQGLYGRNLIKAKFDWSVIAMKFIDAVTDDERI